MEVKNTYNIGIQFWVGLFALISMLCFSYISINIAGMRFSNSGFYNVTALFNNISGLKTGAPVEIAGVKIGEVQEIKLDDIKALVTLQIQNEFVVRDDDIAQIRTKGIIGDKYVKISPGGSDMKVTAGGSISDTESSVDFEEIIGKIIYSLDKPKEEKK